MIATKHTLFFIVFFLAVLPCFPMGYLCCEASPETSAIKEQGKTNIPSREKSKGPQTMASQKSPRPFPFGTTPRELAGRNQEIEDNKSRNEYLKSLQTMKLKDRLFLLAMSDRLCCIYEIDHTPIDSLKEIDWNEIVPKTSYSLGELVAQFRKDLTSRRKLYFESLGFY